MAEINVKLETNDLERLIRRAVTDAVTQVAVDQARNADEVNHGEPGQESGVLLLKPRDAAKRLSISERLLWDLTRSGQIPHLKIGRAVRYDSQDLDEWVRTMKRRGNGKEDSDGKHLA